MFYLLKDNRIIDTNNQTFKKEYTTANGITRYSIETPDETHIHYTFGGGEYEDNIYTFDSTQIKKTSENVFDLIEVGDLVLSDPEGKEKYSVNGIVEITEIRKNDGYISFSTNADSFDFDCKLYGVEWYCIYAIYKPNSNGDYIKVWEKKDE